MNYFELFNIPITLMVPQAQLKSAFYKLSRQYHPDFFSQENDDEQATALEKSAEINKAYKVLRDPLETIGYVLQLKGLLTPDEKYQLSPDFLMDMMELNEQLADAKMDEDEAALLRIRQQIDAVGVEMQESVSSTLLDYTDGQTSEEALLQVKDYYFRKKYLQRILAAIG